MIVASDAVVRDDVHVDNVSHSLVVPVKCDDARGTRRERGCNMGGVVRVEVARDHQPVRIIDDLACQSDLLNIREQTEKGLEAIETRINPVPPDWFTVPTVQPIQPYRLRMQASDDNPEMVGELQAKSSEKMTVLLCLTRFSQ